MIYFIQEENNGPIKIGKCDNHEIRIKQLQTANPKKLTPVAVIPGTIPRETKIKKDLKEFHIRGEWYSPHKSVFEYIKTIQNIEYQDFQGGKFAVLWRDSANSQTDYCPFCGEQHFHGFPDGHRDAHCRRGYKEVRNEDGTILYQKQGYIIKTREQITVKPQKPFRSKFAFVIFPSNNIYHIARLAESEKDYDVTLCKIYLDSKRGVNIMNQYSNGCPTPVVVKNAPKGKRLCNNCKKIKRYLMNLQRW
jgi:hypothetical protein